MTNAVQNPNSTYNIKKNDDSFERNSSEIEKITHRVTLNFSDGVKKHFEVPHHKDILDAALEKEIPVLHQCRSGTCSSCLCTLSEGETSTINGASSTLLRNEYDAGQRLLCISKAETDCSFDVAYGSKVGSTAVKESNVFIDSVKRIGSDAVRLTVELAEGNYMKFLPGQFMQINVPGTEVVRSYSPSSTNDCLPKMEFLIRLIPGGVMSQYLEEQAEVDQVLKLSGPYGSFFLRDEHKRSPHIFVAGGTGLAPILSMIDTLRQKSGIKPKMLLSFGCATPDALFCLSDIELREQWLPTLETRICVSKGAKEGQHYGNPISCLSESDVTRPDTVAYLCGPQPMIDAATSRLLDFGVKADNIFSEHFVASN